MSFPGSDDQQPQAPQPTAQRGVVWLSALLIVANAAVRCVKFGAIVALSGGAMALFLLAAVGLLSLLGR